jgi:hypothetical protein
MVSRSRSWWVRGLTVSELHVFRYVDALFFWVTGLAPSSIVVRVSREKVFLARRATVPVRVGGLSTRPVVRLFVAAFDIMVT